MSSVVERLIAEGRLNRIARDQKLINSLLDQTHLHIMSAELLLRNEDFIAAYLIAYDAVRKLCAALLAYHGLRATSRGGHHALFECIAELSHELRKYLADLEVLRRQRNAYEYPAAAGKAPSASQVQHAVATARAVGRIVSDLVGE